MRHFLSLNKNVGYFMMLFATISLFISLSNVSLAEAKTVMVKSMMFEKCIIHVASVAADLVINPITIVDTDILMIVRFITNDGSGTSFLATCSRPDRKFVLTQSD